MKKRLKAVIRRMYELLILLKICKSQIVIRVDGGICSQMRQYLWGCIFKEKGYKVTFDLSWFDDFGMDMNNKDVRNFDLLKAFPQLDFEKVNGLVLKFYRHFYNYQGRYPYSNDLDWMNLTPPRLLSGYYAEPDYLYSALFPKTFKINLEILDKDDRLLYQGIQSAESAAIHVRRGDLAVELSGYGIPATLDYFKKAIEYMKKEKGVKFFYLFSDDKEYLVKELIPYVKLERNEYIIVQNGADKGYVDMILMSKCDHIITSKGSLGKTAALLNQNIKKTVILCKDDNQSFMMNVDGIEKILI